MTKVLPFYISYINVGLFALTAWGGGFWFLPLFIYNFYVLGTLDALGELNQTNADPDTEDSALLWYRMVTILWFPTQLCISFGGLYYTTQTTVQYAGIGASFHARR